MASNKENEEILEPANPNEYIHELKPTQKSLDFATKLIEKKADITKWDNGYDVNLMNVVGFRHESQLKKKTDAVHEAALLLATELDRGDIVLADNFEAQHGLNKRK